jgi:SagB-type dehydrogenase family enzyme
MRRTMALGLLSALILLAGLMVQAIGQDSPKATKEEGKTQGENMKLPEPKLSGSTSVEEALVARRSIREYSKDSLSLGDVSQLLWAAQGKTADWGGRTAPSAGALYPLEVYLVAGAVQGLDAGLYQYDPEKQAVTQRKKGDLRQEVSEASLHQDEITKAPATIIISAVYERTMVKYGERGIRYVHMEVGSAAENIYLQAEALSLGTVFIGAFDDDQVKLALGIKEEPLAIMPAGRK